MPEIVTVTASMFLSHSSIFLVDYSTKEKVQIDFPAERKYLTPSMSDMTRYSRRQHLSIE